MAPPRAEAARGRVCLAQVHAGRAVGTETGTTFWSSLQVRQRDWQGGHLGGAHELESVRNLLLSVHLVLVVGGCNLGRKPRVAYCEKHNEPHVHLLEKHFAQCP